MNRSHFQSLARVRLTDADALLQAGQWSGAYYLAGYVVECALKACIAKLTNQYDYPDKDFVSKSYTHNLEVLVQVSGLDSQRAAASLGASWLIVKDWNEKARYEQWSENHARRLFSAVQAKVLPWITTHW